MLTNKCKRKNGIRKLPFGKYHGNNYFTQKPPMGIKLMRDSTMRNESEIFTVSKNICTRYSLVTKRNMINSTKQIGRNHSKSPDKCREEQNFTFAAFLTKMNNLHLS